ncbi:MAG: hypothetical protein RI542_06225 [Wenzhouxiangella sp.]|nr:hypothetical protein [Wenzhouxiangella sp.]MDR9453511.1 hypothetical protein [Wenzhouxiangella sp.]
MADNNKLEHDHATNACFKEKAISKQHMCGATWLLRHSLRAGFDGT